MAAIGNGQPFAKDDAISRLGLASYQGSVPTWGKQKLFGISKRDNVYLRRILIYGARAVLLRIKYDTGRFGRWIHRLEARAPRNKLIVAIANKLARMACNNPYSRGEPHPFSLASSHSGPSVGLVSTPARTAVTASATIAAGNLANRSISRGRKRRPSSLALPKHPARIRKRYGPRNKRCESQRRPLGVPLNGVLVLVRQIEVLR